MRRLSRFPVTLCLAALLGCARDNARDGRSAGPRASSIFLAPAPTRWTASGNLAGARSGQTATLLSSGKLLVAGGANGGAALSTAELFDPATGTSSATGALVTARQGHTAVRLQSGKVLLAGGLDGSGAALASCEIYDPATGAFTATAPLATARGNHTAVLLANGRVLALGGTPAAAAASAELYDETAGTWSSAGTLPVAGSLQTATLLASGQVLVAGGVDANGATLQAAQLFDPAQGAWSAAGTMVAPRAGHTATLLVNGQVLVTGGANGGVPQNTAELFNPTAASWTAAAAMSSARAFHSATLLPTGDLLVTGGTSTGSDALAAAEIYLMANASWSGAAAPSAARTSHTATLLPSGQVLVAGGLSAATGGNALASVELFDSARPAFSASGAMTEARFAAVSALLPSGKVLVAGGYNGTAQTASAGLYDPAVNGFAATGPMSLAREYATATLLNTGKVLVAGGAGSAAGSADLYDPASGTFAATGALVTGRSLGTATLLADGRVLLAGGVDATSNATATAEIYDPAKGTFAATGSMGTARSQHTATLLPSGKVLVAGGMGGLGTAEIFDPAAGTWTAAASGLVTGRAAHVAALLPSGKVLLASGENGTSQSLPDAELFDPATGTFAATGALANGRFLAAASVLPSGRVLVAGGLNGSGGVAAAEVYDPATGHFFAAGQLASPRALPVVSALPSGAVLVAGGASDAAGTALATADVFSEGRGASAAWTPAIARFPPTSAFAGRSFTLSGGRFTGVSGASSGATNDSATNFPLLQLRAQDSGATVDLSPASFTATSVTATIPASFPLGQALMRVVVNGVPSLGISLTILPPPPLAISPATVSLAPGAAQTFAAANGTAPYTFSLTTNGSGATLDAAAGTYTAGRTGGTTDVVAVKDAAGAVASATVTVTAGVSVTPATASVAPRGSVTFAAAGGSNTSFTWALTTNGSGGTIDASGNYVAGAKGSTSDVVTATDSLGNTGTATVTVTAGVSITPSPASVPPRGTVTFAAQGGSGPYTWSLSTNASGGSLTPAGVYTAGALANSTDVVQALDALGNSATATVSITAGVSLSPAAPSVAPRTVIQFKATGGSGTGYSFGMQLNSGSGGTMTSTGLYTAGPTGNTTDTIDVTDSLGNSATTTISVTAGVSLAPGAVTLSPHGTQAFVAAGGTGVFTWTVSPNGSGGAVSSAGVYVAGPTGGTHDTVIVTDSAGNSASAQVTITAALSIAPATVVLPPSGTRTFTAAGGSGGYTWSIPANGSGGSITAAGLYIAGTTGGSSDTVTVTDSVGATASATVTVTAGVSITPAQATVSPHGTRSFSAAGGSGAGFSFSLATNASGGAIDTSGRYTAGSTGGVTDVVQAADSLGNVATANVVVSPGVSISPSAPSVAPRGNLSFTAAGGSGNYVFTLAINNSGGSVDESSGRYYAGVQGGVSDVVKVIDDLGNSASATIHVTAGVSISPSSWTLSVRASQVFTATGGSGTGFVWTLATNASGGSIEPTTGRYTAGSSSGVTDVVQATDSLGNKATTPVSVTPGIAITPASSSLVPGATVTFSARGGSGRGYVWSLDSAPSGGTIDASSGVYVAGPNGGVTDVIKVTDSLGNTASASIAVNPAPAFASSGGCASADGSAWPQLLAGALAMLLRPRRKRASAV